MYAATRVLRNSGFLYLKMGITTFITLYTTRIILKTLGAEDFGIFNIVGGAIAMLGFLNAAMASATQRFMSYTEGEGNIEKQKSIFNISVILHITIALLMTVLLAIAGFFFFNGVLNIAPERIHAAKLTYILLIISTLITITSIPYDAVLNAHENMLYYSAVGTVESILKLFVALSVTLYKGDKLIFYGVLMAFIPLISFVIMRIYCHHKYTECVIAPRRYWNHSLLREMAGFAGWSLLGNSSNMILNYGQTLIVNSFFGVLANTAQGIVGQMMGQILGVINQFSKALNPIIAKKEGSGETEAMIKITIFASKVTMYTLLLMYIPLFVEAPLILKLWLTDTPRFAILFLRLSIINAIIGYTFQPVSNSIAVHGKIKQIQTVQSIFSIISLTIIYFLFRNGLPVETVYLTLGIYTIIVAYYSLQIAKKNFKFPIGIFTKTVLFKGFITSSIILSSCETITHIVPEGLTRLFIVVTSSCLILCFIAWAYGFNKNEKKVIIKSIKDIQIRLKSSI